MTTATPPRSVHELEVAVAQARRELEQAEAAERRASDRVSESRQDFALARIARSGLLGEQRELAHRQEEAAQAASAVKAYERLLSEEQERIAAEAATARAEREAALRAAGAALNGQPYVVLRRFLDDLSEFEDEYKRFNSQAGLPTFFRLRGPADFQLIHDRLVDSIQRLLAVYRPATPTSSPEREVRS